MHKHTQRKILCTANRNITKNAKSEQQNQQKVNEKNKNKEQKQKTKQNKTKQNKTRQSQRTYNGPP